MPSRSTTRALAAAVGRTPGLRRIPLVKLLFLAELALIARDHLGRLTPAERRRLFALVRESRGRRGRLDAEQREELAGLVATVEPRRFAGLAAERLSPVPLPKRFVHGPARKSSPR